MTAIQLLTQQQAIQERWLSEIDPIFKQCKEAPKSQIPSEGPNALEFMLKNRIGAEDEKPHPLFPSEIRELVDRGVIKNSDPFVETNRKFALALAYLCSPVFREEIIRAEWTTKDELVQSTPQRTGKTLGRPSNSVNPLSQFITTVAKIRYVPKNADQKPPFLTKTAYEALGESGQDTYDLYENPNIADITRRLDLEVNQASDVTSYMGKLHLTKIPLKKAHHIADICKGLGFDDDEYRQAEKILADMRKKKTEVAKS